MSNILDLGFSNEDVEVRAMRFFGDELYLLDRISANAEFMVHRGSEEGGLWAQVGANTLETPSDMWVDKDNVYLLVNRADKPGLDCLMLPKTAAPGTAWNACPGFPDVVKDGNEDPYSVFAKFAGDAGDVAAWFEMKGMDEATVALYRRAPDSWPEAGSLPTVKPAAWALDSGVILLGFVGTDAPAVMAGVPLQGGDSGAMRAAATGVLNVSGLPTPKDKFSGVVGICPARGKQFVLFLDYASLNSKLYVYKNL